MEYSIWMPSGVLQLVFSGVSSFCTRFESFLRVFCSFSPVSRSRGLLQSTPFVVLSAVARWFDLFRSDFHFYLSVPELIILFVNLPLLRIDLFSTCMFLLLLCILLPPLPCCCLACRVIHFAWGLISLPPLSVTLAK